jgi:HNH endonuclease
MSIDLLSGPGGLASCLRAQTLDEPYNSLSQPLDIGAPTPEVPPHLRKAVIVRDKHCQLPGCAQPPSVCQVHHLIPRSKGGLTALGNLRLLCRFHHLVAIHRWGWKLTCHPDGTTTATGPDGRALHSHGPPSQTA